MTDADDLHVGWCIHGIQRDWCSLCDSPRVFVTAGGECYHSRRDCEALAAGQEKNRELGRSNAPIEETRLGAAVNLHRKPCSVCIGGSSRTEFAGDSRAGSMASVAELDEPFRRFRRQVLERLARADVDLPGDGELAVWFSTGFTSYQAARSIVKGLTPTEAKSGGWSTPSQTST